MGCDIHAHFEIKWWGIDGHSHSWLNADEIREAIEYHEEQINGNYILDTP